LAGTLDERIELKYCFFYMDVCVQASFFAVEGGLGPYNTGPCVPRLGLRGRAEDPLACLPSGFYTGTYKYIYL
jgi:hypothetical protein